MHRAILLLTLLVIGLFVACDNEDSWLVRKLPPWLTGLEGSYTGTYAYIFNPGDGPDTVMQAVWFNFSSTTFHMYADSFGVAFDPQVCLCRSEGTYTITDRVNLSDPGGTPVPDNCETCNPEWGPYGSYRLEQPAGGLKLTSIDSTGPEWVVRELELTKLGSI